MVMVVLEPPVAIVNDAQTAVAEFTVQVAPFAMVTAVLAVGIPLFQRAASDQFPDPEKVDV
jgi:hypothetical protein